MRTRTVVLALVLSLWSLPGRAAEAVEAGTPSLEEMWALVQAQQAEIERLRALVEESRGEVAAARSEAEAATAVAAEARAEAETAQVQLEATALAVEEMADGSGAGQRGWWERTSVGGYGELHANFYDDADGEIDFHRFVLFVNHEFNDWITLYTELEVEHAYSGNNKPGAVELEQAFVRMDWKENFSTDAGLFLMPVGMINEIHEPNTFYGVERNNIESRIIPTTWWEAGVKGNWRFDNGVSVEAGITSGLDIDPSGVIRGGRQKVAKAINEAPAYVARIKYTGVPGLELGASAFYQDDMAQSSPEDVQGLLTEAHVDYSKGGLRLRALYARWDLDGTLTADAEDQWGYFIEPSYRWTMDDFYGDLGVYFRYSDYEYFSGSLKENEIWEIGINYWPIDYVVFKADFQDISNSDQYGSKGDTAVNLGVGYQF
ncbi:MAG: porin [Puniceicoccaceae bacterium]